MCGQTLILFIKLSFSKSNQLPSDISTRDPPARSSAFPRQSRSQSWLRTQELLFQYLELSLQAVCVPQAPCPRTGRIGRDSRARLVEDAICEAMLAEMAGRHDLATLLQED